MDFDGFKTSMQQQVMPSSLSLELQSLWHDGLNDWNKAHDIAQDIPHTNGSWIHAYLHRKEGDKWNANYWYQKAGKPMPSYSLEKEWEELVRYFLKQS
jgi:hypothetical protein